MKIYTKKGDKGETNLFGTNKKVSKASKRVKSACDKNGVRFLESGTPENIKEVIDSGARVIAGQNPKVAEIGRAYSKRTMEI